MKSRFRCVAFLDRKKWTLGVEWHSGKRRDDPLGRTVIVLLCLGPLIIGGEWTT